MPQQSRGDGGEPPGDGGDDLGASDELIAFKDEGEQEEEKRSAAGRDLDDLKTSLVQESETRCSGTPVEPGSRAEAESERRADYNQLLLQALRRQQDGGLLHPSPYVGYPFFMIPDLGNLCSPYITSGALAAGGHTFLPFQWPLLDMQGGAAGRDTTTPTQMTNNVVQHPHLTHLHPLLSYSPEAFSPQRASPSLSPDTSRSRTPHAACYPLSPGGVPQIPRTLGWLQGQPMYSLAGGFSPAALAMNASISSLMSGGFSPRLVTPPPSAAPSTVTLPRGIKQEYDGGGNCSSSSSSSSRQQPGRSREEERPERESMQKVEKKPHIKKPLNAFMLYMREERSRVISECNLKESATINQILGQRWHSLSKDEQSKYYDLARKERLLHSKLYPGWSARDNYGMKKKRKRMRSETPVEAMASSPDVPVQLKRPHLASPHPALPHLSHSHLSQASPASSLDSPATPSVALSSPAAPAATRTDHTFDSDPAPVPGEQLLPLALTTKPPRTPISQHTSFRTSPLPLISSARLRPSPTNQQVP